MENNEKENYISMSRFDVESIISAHPILNEIDEDFYEMPKKDKNFELFRKRRFTNNRYKLIHNLESPTQDDFSFVSSSIDDCLKGKIGTEKSNSDLDNFSTLSVSSFDSLNDYSKIFDKNNLFSQPKEGQPQLRNRLHYIDDNNDKLMIIDDDSLFPSSE